VEAVALGGRHADRPAIFLSYSSKDRGAAQELDSALRDASFSTWFAPRNVEAGDSFAARIVAAIRESSLVIVLFTAGSNGSPHVERELALAVHFRKPILPIRVDKIVPNDTISYFLKLVQWMDVFLPLSDDLPEIIARVRDILDAEQSSRGGSAPCGSELNPAQLLAQRDALHLGYVHADLIVLRARQPTPGDVAVITRLGRWALLLGQRLELPIDVSLFQPAVLAREASTVEFVRRVGRACERIRIQLDSMHDVRIAGAVVLAFRVGGSVLYLNGISRESRLDAVGEWRGLARHVELPAMAFDELQAQVGGINEPESGVRRFRHRSVRYFEDRMIFEVGFAKYRANVWKMGRAAALAAHVQADGGSGEQVDELMFRAETYARALGATIPPLPFRTGDRVGDSAAALHYMLVTLVEQFREELYILFGERFAAVLDAALKSQVLLVLYHPDYEQDDIVTTAADVIERSLGRAGIPADLWHPMVRSVRARAEFSLVRDRLLAMQVAVSKFLTSIDMAI